jgi:hypothetical protein
MIAVQGSAQARSTSSSERLDGGHSFNSVLTDAERRALIEYLKTL